MKAPLKFGVVGCGTVSLRGLIPHLAQDDLADRVRLTALCDPIADRVEHAAHEHGVPHAFTSFDDFLQRGDVDAITIASPIGLHFEQGMKALNAGKHVHFNKTMSVTTEESDKLIELATKKDLRIVASPGEMLRPHNVAVKKMIEQRIKLSAMLHGQLRALRLGRTMKTNQSAILAKV